MIEVVVVLPCVPVTETVRIEAHELGQHLGAPDDRQALGARGLEFRIVALHRRRDDDLACADEVHAVMADEDANALGAQTPHIGGILLVAALNAVAFGEQDLGDGAHADAANADDMERPDIAGHLHGCLSLSFAHEPAVKAMRLAYPVLAASPHARQAYHPRSPARHLDHDRFGPYQSEAYNRLVANSRLEREFLHQVRKLSDGVRPPLALRRPRRRRQSTLAGNQAFDLTLPAGPVKARFCSIHQLAPDSARLVAFSS